jgi:hypothetical protein
VSSEEVVDWDVPFARELEPIGAVPPVRVEVSVREAWVRLARIFLNLLL